MRDPQPDYIIREEHGKYAVYDTTMPKTEEFYFGLCGNGFKTREEAAEFVADLISGAPGSRYSVPR